MRNTCYHAGDDERQDDKLKHSHQDFSWEPKVLLPKMGHRGIVPYHHSKTYSCNRLIERKLKNVSD